MNKTYLIILINLLFVFTTVAMQNKDKAVPDNFENFKDSWSKVQGFESEGKPKSALEVVEGIIVQARKDQNSPQLVKGLLFKFKYEMIVEEESELKVVKSIQEEILNTDNVIAKSLMQSILASSYWDYYQQNRYRSLERSASTANDDEDFRTWDLNYLLNEVKTNFLASIAAKDELQAAQVSAYDAIILKQKESELYRPTLYDLLAHRAIDFFNNAESGITEPINAFSINDERYFAGSKSYIKMEFPKTEPSFEKDVLAIYQELLSFRLTSKNVKALMDADVKRLKFVHQKSSLDNKDALYIAALQAMVKDNVGDDFSAYVNHTIAQFWYNQTHSEVDELNKDTRIKAANLCENSIAKYPNSMGANYCSDLLQEIKLKSVSLQIEQIVVPNQPFKGLLTYRNIDRAYFKIVELKDDEINQRRNYNDREKWIDKLLSKTAVKEWSQAIENNRDFYQHSSEVKLEALPKGTYALLLAYDDGFKQQVNIVQTFWVSAISYVTRSANNTIEFYALDRSNGFPLQDARVDVYYDEYDYNKRQNKRVKLTSVQTDKNGLAKIEHGGDRNYNVYFDINYKGDRLYTNQNNYLYNHREHEPNWRTKTFFFTDRSIYRPGQTVYFKGIIVSTNGSESKIIANKSTSITFKDVNYQDIANLKLVTNEFGSFQGSFTAPSGGLMGSMTIQGENGQTRIQVEEYKRPTFEVKLDTLKGSYSLNQTVSITGKGMSYAGAAIIDATVKYRVKREVRYPYWYYWRRSYNSGSAKEITNGTTKTAADGSFSIDFETLPDLSIAKENQPQFQYTIEVDIVDISGETRSAEKRVTAGYVGLNLSITAPNDWNREQSQEIKIEATNLDGRMEDADVSLVLYQLSPPSELKKSRLWNAPDQFILTEKEHDRIFPNDIYKELDKKDWPKKTIKSFTINTGKTKVLSIDKALISASGFYSIEAVTKDKAGNKIEAYSEFVASSTEDTKLVSPSHLSVQVDQASYQPGEVATISVASSLANGHGILVIGFDGKIIERKYLTFNDNIQKITLPIQSSQRGGISVHAIVVHQNRSYLESTQINVPFESTELDVEWITFRDLLEPGEEQQWKLKIKGPKGDQVASELLASMYDKSLDYFTPHRFNFPVSLNPSLKRIDGFSIGQQFQTTGSSAWRNPARKNFSLNPPRYDQLNLFGFTLSQYGYRSRMVMSVEYESLSEGGAKPRKQKSAAPAPAVAGSVAMANIAMEEDADGVVDKVIVRGESSGEFKPVEEQKPEPKIAPRKNLNETAFFLPMLETNAEGDVLINFTMPEALTTWQFMGFAHDKDLNHKIFTKEIKTQKDLMVTPHFPRFFREGDKITITSKVDNLSDKALNGQAILILKDGLTNKVIDRKLMSNGNKNFAIDAGGSQVVTWDLTIPKFLQAVTYEVMAKAGDFTDGVTSTLPVLTNRMMVTESLPLWLKGKGSKEFTFKSLQTNDSKTLDHHQVTLEYASNPAWYAVQALPYLMEFPHECTEQIFSRYYANALAGHIVKSNPSIQDVFNQWKTNYPEALESNLEKNQELKALLIEETPWLRNAQNESERKKRVALLFDLNRMKNEQRNALIKVQKRQTPNGGFTWFPGMRDSRYITQHIMSSIAHLKELEVNNAINNDIITSIVEKAIPYLDARLVEDLDRIKQYNKGWKTNDHLSSLQIHYLYVRSHFKDFKMNAKTQEAFDYFLGQAEKYWLNKSLYYQGMMAIALNEYDQSVAARKIMASVEENSIVSEEMGMYWKAIEQGGYYWYNAPIESQALLIEAFHKVMDDKDAVNEMKVWLLKQKQVQDWKTTKATTEAIFALLLRGEEWLQSTELATIKVGGKVIDPKKMDATIEPGTGYFKVKWNGESVSKDMAKVEVSSTTDAPSFGAMYWQYFEDLDQIKTFEETPLELKKDIFVEKMTNSGPVITPIKDVKAIQPGDKLKIRIELRVDRNMEFVHMKDMRASGLEPINVMSQYKYQDGLGYYESTKDAATHFFFDYLPKGVYVFEYPLRVAHKGDFSNGITTIQSMYAPEFASHSQGVRVGVE